MLWHDMHGMRRILWRCLCGWGLEFSDMGCYYFGLPFSLKLSQNILADTVLVKVTFNRVDDFIYDRTIDARHYFIRHFRVRKRR